MSRLTLEVIIERLNLKYGKVNALKDVSLQLTENKIYGLLGRNGAGKTSLMSIIASFQQQTNGSIEISGKPPFENSEIMRQVLFAYNKNYDDEQLKVYELLKDTAHYRENFSKDYAEELITRFKIPTNIKVNKLSKGKQAALNATIALASRAPLTLLDEIYVGMDAPTREIFYEQLLKEQQQLPRLFVVSTHLVSEMDYIFDEIIIMHKGSIVVQEDYETLITKVTTVTGEAAIVDDFVKNKQQIDVQKLGPTKAVTIFSPLSDSERQFAFNNDLEIGTVSLQQLFINLTEEDN